MNIFDAHHTCITAVIDNDYYMDIFSKHLHKWNLYTQPITHEKIVSFWNQFWYALPDSGSIHRVPFNLICSICEGEFDE